MKIPHNPFEWIHSEFAYISAEIIGTLAYLRVEKPADHLSTYFQFLIALNGLFWIKKWGNRKNESDTTIKLASITGGKNGKESSVGISSSSRNSGDSGLDATMGQQRD